VVSILLEGFHGLTGRCFRPPIIEQDVFRNYALPRKNKDAQTPWKLEPLWPRRARIEQQCLAKPFNFRLVRVSKDADIWMFTLQERPPFFGHLPAFIQYMTDGNAAAFQLNHGLGRKSALFIIVDVAGDGGDWRDLLQLFDHGPVANITGAENVIDTSEVSPDGRIEQAVGVGNHSDPNGFPLVHGTATG
jgi:hypothetical protein